MFMRCPPFLPTPVVALMSGAAWLFAACGGGQSPAGTAQAETPTASAPSARAVQTAAAASGAVLVVRARGTLAGGVAPLMGVRIDGQWITTTPLSVGATAQDYRFDLATSAAGAQIDIVFSNDGFTRVNGVITEDRNLIVESVSVDGAALSLGQGTVDRGVGDAAFDGLDVIPGQGGLYWNGALRLSAPGTPGLPTQFRVRARGTSAGGQAAQMTVRLEGQVLSPDPQPVDATWRDYVYSVPAGVPAGAHIDVAFINDGVTRVNGVVTEDRNLYVESLTVGAQTLAASAATLDRGAAAAAYDGVDTLPGQSGVYWNGALRFTLPGGGTPLSQSGLGINLEGPSYWSTGWPLINFFTTSSGWFTSCRDWADSGCSGFTAPASAFNTYEQAKLDVDADGWVRSLPAANDSKVKYRRVSTLLFQGDGGHHAAGKYIVLYDGEGTLSYGSRKVDAESRPGRDVIQVAAGEDSVWITLEATVPANYLRNIRVVQPGGVCSSAPGVYVDAASACAAGSTYTSMETLSATQRFHPSYLADLKGMRTLRFMDWSEAILSPIKTWAERTRPTHAFWAYANNDGNVRKGMPYEVMFELAQKTGADPWVNSPVYVDDDFVRQLARLAKGYLQPGQIVYFEYGNEPWNFAYPYNIAGNYYVQQGRAKWPAAGDYDQRVQWHAYRSAQLCKVLKTELGALATQARCVLNTQAAVAWWTDRTLSCELAAGELGMSCAKAHDAVAIAPYFGGHIGLAAATQSWPSQPDGGLDLVFREITGRDAAGNPVTPPLYDPNDSGAAARKTGALDEAKSWMLDTKKVADAHGLPMLAYEGGQHMTSPTEGPVLEMLKRAERDPRMQAAYARYFADWKAAGGQTFAAFSYVGASSVFGLFGIKEYQQDDTAPKWQAIRAERDSRCGWSGCTR